MGLKFRVWRVAFLCVFLLQSFVLADEEDDAAIFMDDLEERYSLECNAQTIANWDYMVDVENATVEAEANDASVKYFNFQAEAAKSVSAYNYTTYDDVSLYREFRFQKDQGPGGLSQEDLTSYQTLQSHMETIYSTATICPMNETENCNLVLEPDIEEIMATSTDWDELKYVWEQWREVTGKLMKEDYITFVNLSNQAAVLDGYPDTGDYWLNGYTVTQKEAEFYGNNTLVPIDQEEFQSLAAEVWNDVSENLYKPLHAYVRLRLKELYPNHVNLVKAMPANILGNMWAQDWTNIAQHVMPFADQPDFDVTQSMIDNNWDIDRMFKAAEDFFVSVGLYKMTDDFWEKSVINQTDWGKTMICHASAEDFCLGPNSTDFRIKMCTNVNMVDLVTVHHEMGHIEYFMSYRDLPHVFRDSANPGFHEAIGDLIALSVSTPEHMENILGLTPTEPGKLSGKATNYTVEEQRDINFLMRMALEKIAFLPFGYLIDKYRWGIFDGSITSKNLNAEWWNLRRSLQGVIPPSDDPRGEEYFDAGAKFHVPANVPYIRYFVSFIVQFQFHKRLCAAAGFEGPLHKCDIYNNTEAGNVLKSALDKGFSEPWPVILNDLGGSYEMSADAIKEYFKPLTDFLAQELDGVFIGWADEGELIYDELARYHLHLMDENMTIYTVQMVETSYTYNTNITDANAEAMNEASVEFSNVYRSWWNNLISTYPSEELSPFYQRQFLMQQSIGTAILDDNNLNELNYHLNMMNGNYTNRVCPFDNMDCKEETEGYDIDYLEKEMATNREYSELLYYWEKWRDNSGQNMIDDFKDYVDLMNLAAKNNSFSDAGEMWIEPYTTHGSSLDSPYNAADFKKDIEGLWSELEEYYKKLHAYVSYKLKKHEDYTDYFEDDNLIPAHILGNMWAQSWENIYDLVEPYPGTDLPDISDLLKERNDTHEMFKIAEDFYYSLGLFNMTDDFWENSMFVNPYPKATAVCHASAWDFYSTDEDNKENGRYRIKMCTDTNQEDFIVIHHEMGHIEYYMSYSNYYEMNRTSPDNHMPLIFRDGANPGFHEAIGDTIALSVSTTTHLAQIEQYFADNPKSKKNVPSVLQRKKKEVEPEPDPELQKINYLMKQALAKIPFLPYAYILDLWRWEVFNGTIKSDNYNKAWWEKRIDYQGVSPPISRSPDVDFDIGCKYHVPASVPYIRYFVAYILQFQFHDKLCKFTNYTENYKCDIYNNTDAGAALLGMLSKGASEHWQKQLGDFLETDGNMDASAIIDYFGPLWDFLDEQQKEHNYEYDWKKSKDVIDDYINDDGEISAVVPIIVGVVLAVLVAIVLVAFFMGQKRRKRMEMEKENEKEQELEKGSIKEKSEKGSERGSVKGSERGSVNENVELEKGNYNEGLELQEKKEDVYNES